MAAKPKPYCTPAMLTLMRAIVAGGAPAAKLETYEAIRSRGWFSPKLGKLTEAGVKYLQEHDKK